MEIIAVSILVVVLFLGNVYQWHKLRYYERIAREMRVAVNDANIRLHKLNKDLSELRGIYDARCRD